LHSFIEACVRLRAFRRARANVETSRAAVRRDEGHRRAMRAEADTAPLIVGAFVVQEADVSIFSHAAAVVRSENKGSMPSSAAGWHASGC
jgi:hypothetical protein